MTGPFSTSHPSSPTDHPKEILPTTAPALQPETTAPAATFAATSFSKYRSRIAQTSAEREAACRLRFEVFNLELGEGLLASYQTGLDQDRFDAVCDHLIIEDTEQNQLVGTYRMQSGAKALNNFGYYSEQEFNFAPYETIRDQVLELGRASIDSRHRTSEVLTLLWRGIVQYARLNGLRYMIGCSSLTSQNPQEGWALYHRLKSFMAPAEFCTVPTEPFRLPQQDTASEEAIKIPRLLKTYLGVGAYVCSEPAWDKEFGTIDFLTLMDIERMTPAARTRFKADTQ